MDSVSPVYSKKEVDYEKVIALDQPEYLPIIVLPVNFESLRNKCPSPHMYAVRFRFSDEDRKSIAEGADLLVGELVYGNLFTPISFQLLKPNESPEN